MSPEQMSGMLFQIQNDIRGVNTNVNSQFAGLQQQFSVLKNEMAQLRTEMVSRAHFEELENRVTVLEQLLPLQIIQT